MDQTAWLLFRGGRYDEAIKKYSELFERDGNPAHLYNRGLAHLAVGEYSAALIDFEAAANSREPSALSSTEYLAKGVCHWCLGQPTLAVVSWRDAAAMPYSDAAGGVVPPALLLYAAERTHDAALQREALLLLRRHGRRRLDAWPGAIVPFLLGKSDDSAVAQQMNTAQNQLLLTRFRCQAEFYLGLGALRTGDQGGFQDHLTRCARSAFGLLEQEYYLARWDVRHQFPDPAFASERAR